MKGGAEPCMVQKMYETFSLSKQLHCKEARGERSSFVACANVDIDLWLQTNGWTVNSMYRARIFDSHWESVNGQICLCDPTIGTNKNMFQPLYICLILL